MKKLFSFIVYVLIFQYQLFSQGTACKTEAKIDMVQSQYGLSGTGVVTVMMDRGLDYRHPDFIQPNGNTRIAYIYDLYDNSGANDPDNPFGVGTIYDSTEINTSLQAGSTPITNDIFGHGTATTGIMSGNGSGMTNNELFMGVAHQSKIISIIVTKDFVPPFGNNPGQQGAFDPNLLPTAFQFASQKIEELGLPSVTLLNIGSIGDPTDGSIGLCDVFDDYVANGNTFVCGVGDDGGKENHAIKTPDPNVATEFFIEKGEPGNLRFTAWYSEQDRFQLTIERPGGSTEGPFAAPSGPSDVQDAFVNQINIFHRGADVEFANSDADLRQLLIDFYGEQGTYKITLTPTQVVSGDQINAFLNPALYWNNNRFLNNDTPGGNINSYSSCPSVISPGDYVATNNWTDIDNIPRSRTGEGLPGEIWIGSSKGPTMDGRLGIDLVAPGEIAAAAYGTNSYYSSFQFNVLQNSNGNYGIQTAVSAAAPIVSGVIALMLEVNPSLTPAEIKMILQETARSDNFTGTTPNATWGHGKLDALAAINKTYETVSTDELTDRPVNLIISPNPFQKEIRIINKEIIPIIKNVSIYSTVGELKMHSTHLNSDIIQLSDLSSGIYFLTIETENSVFIKKIIKN